ncbi:hypothetical protein JOB18_014297 [Solea senegalensis]|uniref:Uncharacterized protein n=1 Tax=Solea senegalensis TaxID=28829 RepID=A0AAV6PJW0_SOLSE|nr:hypothetical protein JOB18_014297 [Solea senegalensis]
MGFSGIYTCFIYSCNSLDANASAGVAIQCCLPPLEFWQLRIRRLYDSVALFYDQPVSARSQIHSGDFFPLKADLAAGRSEWRAAELSRASSQPAFKRWSLLRSCDEQRTVSVKTCQRMLLICRAQC